jgi:phage gpG-like protein
MNVTLSDIRLKNFLKTKHDLDLTNRIEIITNLYEVPLEFEQHISPDMLKRYLNRYGPIYYLKGRKNDYLTQERDNKWFCIDKKDKIVKLSEVYEDVGIPEYLGMKPDELYEVHRPENQS